MKKYKLDIIVVIALVLVAGISWIIINSFCGKGGNYVQVLVDGEVRETYPLDKDGKYRIETDDDINIIEIKDGQVFMKEASCPDKLCIKQGKINKNGQSVICLPNKTVVKVISDKNDEVDAYAK